MESGLVTTPLPHDPTLQRKTGLSRILTRPGAGSGGLRVALVHDWLTGMRGGEKCLEVLCQAFPNATLYTLIHRKKSVSPHIEALRIRTSPLQWIPGVHRHYRKLLPIMPLAARSWRPQSFDLVVSLSHCVAKSVRVPPGVPHVCYCFTPMRYAWHGRDAYLETWSDRPTQRRLASWLLDRLRDWDRDTARGVTHFVAISQTVRQRIKECYGRESEVIPPPVDTAYYTPDPIQRPRESFYLVVSALVAYKRIEQAVKACQILKRRLIVIGEGPERRRLSTIAGPDVSFLGWQPDAVIRDHYRRCQALLFPGEEDFGIVPVEAMACSAPVIALDKGGVAETVTPQTGFLYPEASPEGLAEAIQLWESQGRQRYDPARARQVAEDHALPIFRERVLQLLESVTSRKHPDPSPARSPHIRVGTP